MFIIIDKTDMILGTQVLPAQQAYLSTVWKNKQLLDIVQFIFGNKMISKIVITFSFSFFEP